MLTEKLYHQEPSPMEATAKVIECVKGDQGYLVVLDRTPLYPEGGGQLSDTGVIGDARVSDVQERDGVIYHTVDKELKAGETVTVTVDEEVRWDHSVQHTAEHILSGLANRLYGAVNVGFHMAKDYVSIDLDKPLTKEQVEELEKAANKHVDKNVAVRSFLVTQEEYETIQLRKKAQGLTGEIRVVAIDGADSCTCCGTHCQTTQGVGLVKILSFMHYKGGTRIFFVAGERARQDYRSKHDILESIARRFSTNVFEVENAIVKQGNQLADCKKELHKRTEELMKYRALDLLKSAKVVAGVKVCISTFDNLSQNELKSFAGAVVEREKSVLLLLSPQQESLLYACARSQGVSFSMKELISAVNAAFNGKGGGKDDFAQGSAKAEAYRKETLDQLENYLVKVLENA